MRNSLEGSKNWEHLATGFEAPAEFASGAGNAGATAVQLDLIKSVLLAGSHPKLLKVGPLVQIFR